MTQLHTAIETTATAAIADQAPRLRTLPPVGVPAEVADPGLVRIGAAVGTCPRA